MIVLATHQVPSDAPRTRLDLTCLGAFEQLTSRASARKAIKRGEVLLDGQSVESSRFVQPGQQIELLEPVGPEPPRYQVALDVIHEDDHIAVVVKPPGLAVNGPKLRTLEHGLPRHLTPSSAPDALRWPRPAHRLDAKTGGLVVVGKTGSALASLGRSFETRQVHKRYEAVVIGRMEGEGHIDEPIDDRSAQTTWRAVDHARCLKSDWVTLVELCPHTGRRHQIRKHLSDLGFPILGDIPYGLTGLTLRGKGLFLWAVGLTLPHPATLEPQTYVTPHPAKFDTFMRREQRRWERQNAKTLATEPTRD